MTDNFCFFTFSLFRGCSFSEFSNAVINSPFYGGLIHHKKAHLKTHDKLFIDNYLNPEIGCVLAKFSWWTSELYPNIVFLSSNCADGLQTGCYSFQNILKCSCIDYSVSTDQCYYQKNHFEHISSDGKERLVMALKEDRWTFYQEGEVLPFENPDYYNNRKIKDRMNFSVIKEYLFKIGIDFYRIDTNVCDCTTYIRTEWGK